MFDVGFSSIEGYALFLSSSTEFDYITFDVWETHTFTASSLRSFARLAGRWRDHPMLSLKIRHTWPW